MAMKIKKGDRVRVLIIDKDMPLPVDNVAVVCSTCGATRVGFRFDDQGRKVRVCKKCGNDL